MTDGAEIFIRRRNDNLVLDPQRTAEYLKGHGFVFHDGKRYQYTGRGYRAISKTEMISEVYRLVSEMGCADYVVFPSTVLINDAIRRWQALWEMMPFDTDAVRDDLRYDGYLVAFGNGLYNVDRDILAPHTEDALVPERFDFDFNPAITDDRMEWDYRRILDDSEYDTYFAALGRTLFSYDCPTFMTVIHGDFNTGKSFLYHTLDRLCVQGSFSYIACRDIDPASTPAYVEGKVANMDPFVSFEGKQSRSYRNRLIPLMTGQELTAREKYGPKRRIVNSTPFWFKTDELFYRNDFPPELSDRMYCIHCAHAQGDGQGRCDKLENVRSRQWVVNEALRMYRRYGQSVPNAPAGDTLDMYFLGLGLSARDEIGAYLDGRNTIGTYKDYLARTERFMMPMSRLQFLDHVRSRYGMGIKHKSVRTGDGFSSINVFYRATP